MQTTSILVEHLVVGLEAAILGLVAVAAIFGEPVDGQLSKLGVAQVAAIPFLLYPLGIVWSRVCDWLVASTDDRLKDARFGGAGADEADTRYRKSLVAVLLQSDTLAERLSVIRSQYRVARASSVSCIVAALLVSIIVLRDVSIGFLPPWFLVSLLIILGVISFRCWKHLRGHYFALVRSAAEALESIQGNQRK